jgi:hypothetical protein
MAAYHAWYDIVHLPQVLTLEGIVSARRLAPVDEDGPFVALYEIESEDLRATRELIMAAGRDGRFALSEALQTRPFPTMRLWETICAVGPAAS